ncbi:PREDICTED: ly6/PLAUR domain-containing protein 3 [Nanorana parkeri]|uniref:ly6/PLAUR domain-containing protein 3 n=1 Tax=Nanorana parkeri TaxID=125878 RepID=UPI000854B209|nr:PREDICTED: ly6/PLAUR domain-containing protein 3 [Nanorana parkeri]
MVGMKSSIFGMSSVTMICLISFLGLKGVQAVVTECYTCTDRGDGGCSPDKAVNVSCPLDHDMCLETITAIKTSHANHVVLKKGCGYGVPTMLKQSIISYGISIYMQLNQCNTSLCNTNMDLKHYQLAPDDNVTHVPNDEQCYSCVGTPDAECSPSNAPVMQCYDTYSHCFDGNITISIGNDTTAIPVKSCSMRHRCSSHSLTYGSATVQIKGACCSEGLCNSDLSNKTEQENLPYLVLLNHHNEEPQATVAPPQWINVTAETNVTPTSSSIASNEGGSKSKSMPQDSEGNAANGLSFSLWLFLTLIMLS